MQPIRLQMAPTSMKTDDSHNKIKMLSKCAIIIIFQYSDHREVGGRGCSLYIRRGAKFTFVPTPACRIPVSKATV